MNVRIFKVGHGDNILLKFSNKKWGMIDFFYKKPHKSPPSITFLLNESKINYIDIDFINISHFDKDHYKGVNFILEKADSARINIAEIWISASLEPSSLSKQLKDKIIRKETNADLEDVLQKLNDFDNKGKLKRLCGFETIDKSVRATVLNPIFKDVWMNTIETITDEKHKNKRNETSTAIKIIYDNYRLIFGADVPATEWLQIIERCKNFDENPILLESHFIKASHHGAANATHPTKWKKIIRQDGETHIIFTVGNQKDDNGDLKYPHQNTINDINSLARNPKLYATNDFFEKGSTTQNVVESPTLKDNLCSATYILTFQQPSLAFPASGIEFSFENTISSKYF